MSWKTTGNAGTDPANDFVGTTDEQPLILRTNGGEALRINPDGRVGVGTTAPASQLEIVGNWNDGQLGALKLTGDKPSIETSPGEFPQEMSRGPFTLGLVVLGTWSSSGRRGPLAFDHVLTLTPTGRVGIGTSTPSSQLEIVGNWNDGQLGALKLTGDKPSIKFAGGIPAGNEYGGPFTLGLVVLGTWSSSGSGPLAFDHVLTLTPTGRVGIGTSTPSSKLEVVADSGKLAGLFEGDVKVTGKLESPTVSDLLQRINDLRGIAVVNSDAGGMSIGGPASFVPLSLSVSEPGLYIVLARRGHLKRRRCPAGQRPDLPRRRGCDRPGRREDSGKARMSLSLQGMLQIRPQCAEGVEPALRDLQGGRQPVLNRSHPSFRI